MHDQIAQIKEALLLKRREIFLVIISTTSLHSSSHGRVVKASDSKSDGFYPRKFESCWLRFLIT